MASHTINHNSLPSEQVFLVGGAVRDELLGLPVKDRDWVVVGSTPEFMQSAGFQQVGADFPVFLHPLSKDEYALARTERKTGAGYQGFVCDASDKVTLEEDLERRDLTINAMALDTQGRLIDPFNGQHDLQNKVLRHVSPAFVEDPLRVLRIARFAARYHNHGFTIASETLALMTKLSRSGELDHLTTERVWQETQRALGENSPWVYFEVLRDCSALAVLMPELESLFGVPQPEKHHPEIDTGLHALLSLKAAAIESKDTDVRFAALIHDLGKALTPKENWPTHHGHERLGLDPIRRLCSRLKIPKAHTQLALLTCEFHTHTHKAFELRPETVLKVLKSNDALRNPDRFRKFLLACEADAHGRTGLENNAYPQKAYFEAALACCKGIDIANIRQRTGLEGKALGQAIDRARIEELNALKKATLAATE